MNEMWKDIPGFVGLYKASNTGKIRSVERYLIVDGVKGKKLRKGRILKSKAGPYGYHRVGLIGGPFKAATVHKLVALAWLGEMPVHKTQLDHIDGDPENNNIENLRYVTNAENQIYAYRARVENGIVNPNLGRDKERPVILSKIGKKSEQFPSAAKACIWLGCNKDGVSKAASGYNKTIYGWTAEYLEEKGTENNNN